MSFKLVWKNTIYQKARTLLALAAISFAIVLLFVQLALHDSLETSAVIMTDALEFDAVVLGASYYCIQQPGSLPRTRLYEALAVPGVQSASPLYMSTMPWRNVDNGTRHVLMILGVPLGDPIFRNEEIRAQLPGLHRTDGAIMDRRTLAFYGPIHKGLVSEAGGHQLELMGSFTNGTGFSGGGLIIVSDRTFNRLGNSLQSPALGLIRLEPGQDLDAAVQRIQAALPPDVRVLTRAQLAEHERHYWISAKPIGMMFTSGLYVGFIVGAVILYQVLGNDVTRRLREFATMKAMGFSNGQINGIVMQQSFLYMLLSFLAGLAISTLLYDAMTKGAGIPVLMTWQRIVSVFLMVCAIALGSGALALRKLRTADPAELF